MEHVIDLELSYKYSRSRLISLSLSLHIEIMDPSTETTLLRYFHYIPNKTLAIVALVIYIVLGVVLTIITYRSKCKRFLYILPGTSFALALGYLLRMLCLNGVSLGLYIGMTFFLLLPPNALALVNYKAAAEIIRLSNVQPKHFFVKYKFVKWFFISSDILAFWLQAGGGGLQAANNINMANIGRYITIVGLVIQLFFFGCFAFVCVYLHRRPQYNYTVEGVSKPKEKLLFSLYVTIALIYVRSIYRFAEYVDGYTGAIATAEWALYVFDSLAIAISLVLYSIFFMGYYLPKRGSVEDKMITRLPTSSSSLEVNHVESDKNLINNAEEIRLYRFKK